MFQKIHEDGKIKWSMATKVWPRRDGGNIEWSQLTIDIFRIIRDNL